MKGRVYAFGLALHIVRANGPAVMLVNSSGIYPDDFTVDFEGNAWIASDLLNQLDQLNGGALIVGLSKKALKW
jgi:hypothetical protein